MNIKNIEENEDNMKKGDTDEVFDIEESIKIEKEDDFGINYICSYSGDAEMEDEV